MRSTNIPKTAHNITAGITDSQIEIPMLVKKGIEKTIIYPPTMIKSP